MVDLGNADLDPDDENTDLFTVGRKVKIALKDMDYISWRNDLSGDLEVFNLLIGAGCVDDAPDEERDNYFHVDTH